MLGEGRNDSFGEDEDEDRYGDLGARGGEEETLLLLTPLPLAPRVLVLNDLEDEEV